MASVRSLSSRWLALALTAAYVLVSAVIGTALLTMPRTDPNAVRQATLPPTYVADDGRRDAPDPTKTAPAGYERVAGPADVATVIPAGWLVAATDQPDIMRATDPTRADRFVGFGGAKIKGADFAEARVAAESAFAEKATGYHRIDMSTATYAGHPAVQWEFQHDDGRGVQHVRSLSWRVSGTEYTVFASGPDAQWQQMRPIYDAMVGYSSP